MEVRTPENIPVPQGSHVFRQDL
ncbi:hypothetical protein OOU_Y34scaffold00947g1 [Pyricularia oryzae Y34]|uniref:Uncharacterized protein n=1 Tax=Pyricularia oryzae (strain Y34) TaxID=1143189 RepID=A0AA97NNL2_PYRO3|nr:hypothetical protein OOU_Y34scaffold00947g1 [Pyricularia oryzae Y34]